MLFRFFFRQIADSWVLIGLSLLMMAVSMVGMLRLSEPLISLLKSNHPGQEHHIPDVRFSGYTISELNTFYDQLGMEGCRMYIAVENWDLFPFMIAYTLCLGTFLTMLSRKFYNTRQDSLSLLAMVIWMLDVVETVIQRKGCMIYPDRLPDPHILLASGAVQLKWKLGIISIFIVVAGSMRVLWQEMTASTKTTTMSSKKQK